MSHDYRHKTLFQVVSFFLLFLRKSKSLLSLLTIPYLLISISIAIVNALLMICIKRSGFTFTFFDVSQYFSQVLVELVLVDVTSTF